MNCKVQYLFKNIRYRILIIDGEHYILDMERSFWKIIFPFFMWMFPTLVFKVDDQKTVERLQTKEKAGSSLVMFIVGISFILGNLLTPLMDYFEIQSSLLVNIMLVFPALILVALIYYSISRMRKQRMYTVVKFDTLPKNELWIRPRSVKQFFKVLYVYIVFFGFVLLSFLLFIQTGNIMALIIASGLLFFALLTSRITVEEGHTKVKFKGDKNAAS
ncbi:DUF443 family protein [Virgibacillus natechei]